MNAFTKDILAGKDVTHSQDLAPRKVYRSPRGSGAAALRKLLSVIARKTEDFTFQWSDAPWKLVLTDCDMLMGHARALDHFGITSDDFIEATDSPVRFTVKSPGGAKRTIQFDWSTISDDMMKLPPHTNPYNTTVCIAATCMASIGLWSGIVALARAVGWL